MSLKPPTQNARTAKRQFEIEQIYLTRKEEIIADIEDLENNATDLVKNDGFG